MGEYFRGLTATRPATEYTGAAVLILTSPATVATGYFLQGITIDPAKSVYMANSDGVCLGERSSQLTVLAAAPVTSGKFGHIAIMNVLTGHAQANPTKCGPPCLRDLISAFRTVS